MGRLTGVGCRLAPESSRGFFRAGFRASNGGPENRISCAGRPGFPSHAPAQPHRWASLRQAEDELVRELTSRRVVGAEREADVRFAQSLLVVA